MALVYLGFVLLTWFPGVLHAAAVICPAPNLTRGYFVPQSEIYNEGEKIMYACNTGYKPAMEIWWGSSTCQNGEWIDKALCIQNKDCFPPKIHNARKIKDNKNGWYEETNKVRISCEKGYENRESAATTTCQIGEWSPVLVCHKKEDTCGEPPRVDHAVIVLQGYQDFFPVDSKVYYHCKDGYTIDGVTKNKTLYCINGNWGLRPTCSKETGGTERRGSSSEPGENVQPPNSPDNSKQPLEPRPRPTSIPGRETGGTEQRGSSSEPGENVQPPNSPDNSKQPLEPRPRPTSIPVTNCGEQPQIANAVMVENDPFFLKYQCSAFYKLENSGIVTCRSTGQWSHLPNCIEAFCVLHRGNYLGGRLHLAQDEYLKEGERKYFPCNLSRYYTHVQCNNKIPTLTKCCFSYYPGNCDPA